MPDLALLLDETNRLLARNELPTCHSLMPVSDGDTANPNVIAHSRDRQYVVKVTQRHPDTLDSQREVANALRGRTDLPIPRHYCCASAGDRLPLMVMEWLPGEQFRTVLAKAEGQSLGRLCAGLARCLAVFHAPDHLDLVPEMEGRHLEWLYARTSEALQHIVSEPSCGGAGKFDVVAVERFLEARLGELTAPRIPSLEKADLDMRDFLADPEGFDITGMLDWERVARGDGVLAVTLIFFRLWLNGKLGGWNDFLSAYNQLAAVPAEQCPQAEFYLMCRAVLSYRLNDGVGELIDLLLEGRQLPFEDDARSG